MQPLQTVPESYAKELNKPIYIKETRIESAEYPILTNYEIETNEKWDQGGETKISTLYWAR